MFQRIDTADRPLVFAWERTQACDLACVHCRADACPDRHPDELSTSEGKALLDSLRSFGEGQLVVLTGGDPCKRADLVELVEYGTALGLTITLTPSATSRLTRDVLSELVDAGLRRVALSLDCAHASAHDAFRGEPGIFAETVRAAHDVRDVGLPLQINTTVCETTVEALPELRDQVRALDAVFWAVFFLVPVGRASALTPITPARAEQVLAWLAAVSGEESFGLKTTEAPHFRRVKAQDGNGQDSDPGLDQVKLEQANESNRRQGVIAGDGFAFVSHTGEIYPSGFLPKSAGNVRDVDPVWVYRHSPLFESLRDREALRGKCGACPFRYRCGGSRSRAYAYTGDPLESDPLCVYTPPEYDGPMPAQQFD